MVPPTVCCLDALLPISWCASEYLLAGKYCTYRMHLSAGFGSGTNSQTRDQAASCLVLSAWFPVLLNRCDGGFPRSYRVLAAGPTLTASEPLLPDLMRTRFWPDLDPIRTRNPGADSNRRLFVQAVPKVFVQILLESNVIWWVFWGSGFHFTS